MDLEHIAVLDHPPADALREALDGPVVIDDHQEIDVALDPIFTSCDRTEKEHRVQPVAERVAQVVGEGLRGVSPAIAHRG